MRCPFCDADKESLKVIDSRTCEGGRSIRRRRECMQCDKRFTTYERIEDPIKLIVVKRDGRRVPWDRAKIRAGLERACFKRPVPESEILRIVDEVEDEIFTAEPGLYGPHINGGIRIENDYLVTATGVTNLLNAPVELA